METHGTQTAVKHNISAETQIDDLQQELFRARSKGDRPAEAKALENIGTAYGWGGEYAEAIGCFQESIAIARELGNKEAEWTGLWNLGAAYEQCDNFEEELAAFTRAEEITKELADAVKTIPEPSLIKLHVPTKLGQDLWKIRQQVIASGLPLLTSEEVAQELNERRGIRG